GSAISRRDAPISARPGSTPSAISLRSRRRRRSTTSSSLRASKSTGAHAGSGPSGMGLAVASVVAAAMAPLSAARRPRMRLRRSGGLVLRFLPVVAEREVDPEPRAPVDRVEPDPPVVCLDDAPRYGEAEPRPRNAGGRGVAAVERLEDLLAMLRRDPRALVVDPDARGALRPDGPDRDPAALGRVLDGVREDVPDHLCQA